MKTTNEILTDALNGIVRYTENWRPEGEYALKAQISLIGEWARSALEEAEEVEKSRI